MRLDKVRVCAKEVVSIDEALWLTSGVAGVARVQIAEDDAADSLDAGCLSVARCVVDSSAEPVVSKEGSCRARLTGGAKMVCVVS